MEGFDLSTVDVKPRSQEGVEMQLLGPDRLPLPVWLRVRGTDSDAYQHKSEEIMARSLERAGRRQTQEEKNAEVWELQATLICGWRPKLALGKGQPAVEYSPENAQKLLREHGYIFEQVHLFSRDRQNFLPGPASSSSGT